ncbi:hypothetical protein KKI23_01585 [Patescibacteria group bacterium]|nr:hypothetical protein [Patescibacteria group bacterium]
MEEETKQPEEAKPEEQKPKKKSHKLLWTLIILIFIFIVLPLAALGYSGVYQIPVVSAIFGTNKPIDLGVNPTAQDLIQAEADNPMTIDAEPGTFYWTQSKEFAGTVEVDDRHTSAEMTAFIEKYHGEGRHVSDIQVKLREGGMEISAFVTPYINAPVYVDVDVALTSNNTVSVNLVKAKVGRLSVPSSYYDEVSEAAQEIINEELAKVPGLSIEKLEYSDGEAYLKGVLPKTVTATGTEESLDSYLD